VDLDKARQRVMVEVDLLTWMAVHGNLLLALRHPHNVGLSGQRVQDFVCELGEMLVKEGLLSRAELDHVMKVESDVRGRAQ
jgi:hypothetical protein